MHFEITEILLKKYTENVRSFPGEKKGKQQQLLFKMRLIPALKKNVFPSSLPLYYRALIDAARPPPIRSNMDSSQTCLQAYSSFLVWLVSNTYIKYPTIFRLSMVQWLRFLRLLQKCKIFFCFRGKKLKVRIDVNNSR